MAITHSTAARNAAAAAVVALCDSGTVDYRTAADALVAQGAFSATAFGAPVSGVATANAIGDDTNAPGGTTTKIEARDNSNNIVFQGTVGGPGSGADAEMSPSNVVTAGATVQTSSMTYTAQP